MKTDHIDLVTGILFGAVVGGMYGTHLGIVLQIAFGVLVLMVLLKVVGGLLK